MPKILIMCWLTRYICKICGLNYCEIRSRAWVIILRLLTRDNSSLDQLEQPLKHPVVKQFSASNYFERGLENHTERSLLAGPQIVGMVDSTGQREGLASPSIASSHSHEKGELR